MFQVRMIWDDGEPGEWTTIQYREAVHIVAWLEGFLKDNRHTVEIRLAPATPEEA